MKFIFSDGTEIEMDVSPNIVGRSRFLSSFEDMEENVILPQIKNLFSETHLLPKNYFLPLFHEDEEEFDVEEILFNLKERISFFEFIGDDFSILEDVTNVLLFLYENPPSGKGEYSFLETKLEMGWIISGCASSDLLEKLMELNNYDDLGEKYTFEKIFINLQFLFYFQKEEFNLPSYWSGSNITPTEDQSSFLLENVAKCLKEMNLREMSPSSMRLVFTLLSKEDSALLKEILIEECYDFFSCLGGEMRDNILSHQGISEWEKKIFCVFSFFGIEVCKLYEEKTEEILNKVYHLFAGANDSTSIRSDDDSDTSTSSDGSDSDDSTSTSSRSDSSHDICYNLELVFGKILNGWECNDGEYSFETRDRSPPRDKDMDILDFSPPHSP